jgi:hypothetical protein
MKINKEDVIKGLSSMFDNEIETISFLKKSLVNYKGRDNMISQVNDNIEMADERATILDNAITLIRGES